MKRCWWLMVACIGWFGAAVACADDENPTPHLERICDPCLGQETDTCNPILSDRDGDGSVDACDVCPDVADPLQHDADRDGVGDACSPDDDGDGVPDERDTCPTVVQVLHEDLDGDGLGDVCDPCPAGEDLRDQDRDGLNDCIDLCPTLPSSSNTDTDGDGIGDVCDSCPTTPNANQTDRDNDQRGDACSPPTATTLSIVEATISDLHNALLSQRTTCSEILEATLTRIQRYDLDVSQGPPLNAFVTFNINLRTQAQALDDAQSSTGTLSGSLHCVPILVKDLFNTQETPTSTGTLALAHSYARTDAFLVARLREQGALILGTSSMDEFSSGVYGISSRSGKTGNAYDTRHNAGGSSSGSAVAVSASFALGSIGTDNCGSLILPASYNGLVSMRPTVGLVSLSGSYPSNAHDAVAAPMTRTVRDFATLLNAIAHQDPYDPDTLDPTRSRPSSYLTNLSPDALRGKRIGVLRSFAPPDALDNHWRSLWEGGDPETQRVFQRSLRTLEALGATLVENVTFDDLDPHRGGAGAFGEEVAPFLNAYQEGPVRSFEDLCDTGRFSRFIWPDSASCLRAWQNMRSRAPRDSAAFRDLGARYDANRARAHALMDRANLDALVYPADAWGAARDFFSNKSSCFVSATSKVPTITFPIGATHPHGPTGPALPVGLVLQGRAFSEDTLLAMAYAYETATQHRTPPTLHSADPPETLPPFDLEHANTQRLNLGEEVWSRVLRTQDRWDLTPEVMRDITRDVLRDF